MRLYEEIFKNALLTDRCILLPGGGGYFEGVKAVGEFSSEKIELCFAKRKVTLEGVDLSIKKYCDGDLRIGGKIVALYLGEKNKGNKEG